MISLCRRGSWIVDPRNEVGGNYSIIINGCACAPRVKRTCVKVPLIALARCHPAHNANLSCIYAFSGSGGDKIMTGRNESPVQSKVPVT